jgi:membrane protein implicated in regulation of membrane protease activity
VTAFIVIGGVGLAIVLASLILGDFLDGVFDALDLDLGGGLFSAPVIGSFLAAFGFGASLVMASVGVGAVGGTFGGVAAGAVVGGIALVLTRSLMNMPTDPSFRTGDLVGTTGYVITRIPEGGLGEISLTHLGQAKKFNARSKAPIPAGETVRVVAVTSSSSVMVEPAGQPHTHSGEQ